MVTLRLEQPRQRRDSRPSRISSIVIPAERSRFQTGTVD
jgi:hypothetical protein